MITTNTKSHIKVDNIFKIAQDPGSVEWQTLREGVDIYPIYKSEDTKGASAAILRLHPGTMIPEHLHTGYENILVLAGFQTDDDNSYTTGDFVAFYPGSSHRVHSKNGGIVLAIWEKPIQFL